MFKLNRTKRLTISWSVRLLLFVNTVQLFVIDEVHAETVTSCKCLFVCSSIVKLCFWFRVVYKSLPSRSLTLLFLFNVVCWSL